MELKTDSSHKKIDLRKLDLMKAKKLGVKIGAGVLTMFMLSGCQKKNDNTNTSEVVPSIQHEEVLDDEFVTTEDIIIPEEKPKKVYDIEEHSDDEVVGITGLGHFFVTEDGEWLKKYDEDGNFISPTSGDNYYGRITYGDLKKIVECNITVDGKKNASFDFLNYMPNLKKLEITIYPNSDGVNFAGIDGSRFSNSIDIEISVIKDDSFFPSLTEENFGFLEDIGDISTLELDGDINIDSNFIKSLKNVHNLKLDLDNGYKNFNCRGLTYLDSLTLSGQLYDVLMYISNEDIENLENSGVVINYDELDELKSLNRQIDEIVAGLNVSENASEQEKLNAILVYVLDEYEYDEEVSNSIQNTTSTSIDYSKFYGDGHLTGNFLSDTQICGNYAAMTYTLCQRLGLDSYTLLSCNHLWNAVKIEDYYYYVDSTWLDGEKIKKNIMVPSKDDPNMLVVDEVIEYGAQDILKPDGDKSEVEYFNWYLEDPTEISEIETNHKESHDLLYTPAGLELKDVPEDVEDFVKYKKTIEEQEENTTVATTEDILDIEEKDIKDISDKKFHVNINGKTVIIGAAAFVGILAGLGVGTLVHKKRVEERRRLRARQRELERQRYMDDMFKNANRFNSNNYNNGGFRF